MAFLLKSLLFSYILTGVMLALLAFLLYRFGLGERAVSVAIIVIYVVATRFSGIMARKRIKSRRGLPVSRIAGRHADKAQPASAGPCAGGRLFPGFGGGFSDCRERGCADRKFFFYDAGPLRGGRNAWRDAELRG